MAEPVKFQGANHTLGAPKGMEEEVLQLPCRVPITREEDQVIQSCWELTDDEVEYICRHKKIRLTVIGLIHPPIALHVNPLEK